MKTIDKIIIAIVTVASVFAISYAAVFHLFISLKILSVVLAIAYGFFILLHISLLFPLAVIFMATGDVIRNSSILGVIGAESRVLLWLAKALIHLLVIFIIYFVVPIIIAMLYNGHINVDHALDTLYCVGLKIK